MFWTPFIQHLKSICQGNQFLRTFHALKQVADHAHQHGTSGGSCRLASLHWACCIKLCGQLKGIKLWEGSSGQPGDAPLETDVSCIPEGCCAIKSAPSIEGVGDTNGEGDTGGRGSNAVPEANVFGCVACSSCAARSRFRASSAVKPCKLLHLRHLGDASDPL